MFILSFTFVCHNWLQLLLIIVIVL